ncbi:MAG: TPM domain-containing protein [Candidatus Diapherotrites archaeon]|nr:TPM domain-containing protein [Candidatus Diapherotrites archaeon]
MNKTFLFLFLLILVPFSAAQEYPNYVGYVNDFADVISPSAESQLTSMISALESEKTAEIAIVTIPSLENNSLELYAVELFEKWGIGKKGADNGILILVTMEEREIRIEVGYGLEGAINDAKAGRIIRDVISPRFKEGNYDQGLIDGTQTIAEIIRGEPTPQLEDNSGSEIIGVIIFAIAFFIIMLAIILAVKAPKGKGGKGGRIHAGWSSSSGSSSHGGGGFGGGSSGGGGASGGW